MNVRNKRHNIVTFFVIFFALVIGRDSFAQSAVLLLTDIAWSATSNQIALGIGDWGEDNLLQTCGRGSQITIESFPSGEVTQYTRSEFGCLPATLHFSNSNSEILVTDGSGLDIWNLSTGELNAGLTWGTVFQNVAYNPSYSEVLATTASEVVITSNSLSPIQSFASPSSDDSSVLLYSAWSPDGQKIATSNSDGTVYIWNSDNAQLLITFQEHTGGVKRLAWNPTNNTIISGDDNGIIWLWDATSGQPIRQFVGHAGIVYDMDWHPNGLEFVSAGADGTLRTWDAVNGSMRIVDSSTLYSAVAYSPDGNQLAYGGLVNDPLIPDIELVDVGETHPNTVMLSPTPPNPLTLSEETRAWYNYTITLSATLTGSECVTVELDYYPPTPSNYAHVQTRVKRPTGQEVSWSTAQTLVFDANHTEYEVRIRARDDSTNHTGAVGRLGHRIIENEASGCTSAAGFVVNTVDASGMRLTGSPFNGGNDASAAADSRNVLVFTVADND